MKPVGFAVAGAGMVAGVHIAALRAIPGADVVGAWSRSEAHTRSFAGEHGVKGYRSYEELLLDTAVQAVAICLPGAYHAEYGIKAADAGKHVIVEKPIDITLSRARDLIQGCRAKRVKLSVIFQNRFTPAAQRVRNALGQGLLGELILGDAYVKWYRTPQYYTGNAWRGKKAVEGGGALINQAIHTIDLLQWLMGGIRSLTGFVRTSTHAIESEDLGVAAVEYLNGALGVIEGSTAIQPGFKERIEIHGRKGSVTLEGGNIREWKVDGCNEADYVDARTITYGATNSPAISPVNHQAQYEEIVRAILEDRDPPIPGEEGIKALEIVLGVYESNRTGHKVIVSRES
jgi:UDP-N-acetyl-2-amino-2-deoxyglucuronate dehydrogenase